MIGYCVSPLPALASYRLRVAIPRQHLGMVSTLGIGDPTFFYKSGDPNLARRLSSKIVYDVVNDHFRGSQNYYAMCDVADVLTCSSLTIADTIWRYTGGRWPTVIDDPYENEEKPAAVVGEDVLWFGHGANITSLSPYADVVTTICSNVAGTTPWTPQNEARCIDDAAVVLLTGNNPGASSNRVAKAIRAGRFVVTPGGVPAWEAMREYIWIGDVREGVKWALNNREEACSKIRAGQKYVREMFSPPLIGLQWADLFALTSAPDTRKRPAGSASISP